MWYQTKCGNRVRIHQDRLNDLKMYGVIQDRTLIAQDTEDMPLTLGRYTVWLDEDQEVIDLPPMRLMTSSKIA